MIIGLLQWWYIGGWKIFVSGLGERLKNSADFFSIGLLARTLFAPFRQISAGETGQSLGDRIRAFGDRLFSRIVGAVVRTLIIFIGIIALAFQAIIGAMLAIMWPFIPLMPVVCLILTIVGVHF